MRGLIIIAIVSAATASAGCNDDRRYIGPNGVYQVALTMDTPAAFTAGMDSIYVVERRIEFPVRQPSDLELNDLRSAVSRFAKLPFPRLPWVNKGDLEVQVDFTLENLDPAQTQEVAVTLNGFDEFFEYQPGVQIIDEALVPDYSEWERLYKLKPKERITRSIREEDLDEAAVDLATAVNGAPNSNELMFFENKSYDDPRAKPYIPKVIPGLMGMRLGMRATGKGTLLLEASVRVRDVSDRLAASGEAVFHVHPKLFMPVAPMN